MPFWIPEAVTMTRFVRILSTLVFPPNQILIPRLYVIANPLAVASVKRVVRFADRCGPASRFAMAARRFLSCRRSSERIGRCRIVCRCPVFVERTAKRQAVRVRAATVYAR